MSDRWTGSTSATTGSTRLPLGPLGDSLPSAFGATVTASEDGLTATLAFRWDGSSRVAVDVVSIRRADGSSLAARDLTRVQLAEIVRWAVVGNVRGGNVLNVPHRHGQPMTDEELALLTAVYWFHYVSWGNPRRAVMGVWGLSRTTANRWITKAADVYPMPERDAD